MVALLGAPHVAPGKLVMCRVGVFGADVAVVADDVDPGQCVGAGDAHADLALDGRRQLGAHGPAVEAEGQADPGACGAVASSGAESVEERAALERRRVGGLNPAAIAHASATPVGAVEQRVARPPVVRLRACDDAEAVAAGQGVLDVVSVGLAPARRAVLGEVADLERLARLLGAAPQRVDLDQALELGVPPIEVPPHRRGRAGRVVGHDQRVLDADVVLQRPP